MGSALVAYIVVLIIVLIIRCKTSHPFEPVTRTCMLSGDC